MGNITYRTNKKKDKAVKILLLGLTGSGKSTFVKQMKLLHMGFSADDLETYKALLRHNVIVGMKELTLHAKMNKTKRVSEENRKHIRYLLECEQGNLQYSDKIIKKLRILWKDPSIQEVWKKSLYLHLQITNMDYLMNNVARIMHPDFVPTPKDILYARQRTTGVTYSEFGIDKYRWELIDVGGHSPERNKWEKIIAEEETNAIIFFSALDDYNVTCADDLNKTQMDVSMQVFEEIMSSTRLRYNCAVLFLNKVDLLEKKIQIKSNFDAFKRIYPEYSGRSSSEHICNFIKSKFEELVTPDRQFHTHIICAINTDHMRTVFESIESIISESIIGL